MKLIILTVLGAACLFAGLFLSGCSGLTGTVCKDGHCVTVTTNGPPR